MPELSLNPDRRKRLQSLISMDEEKSIHWNDRVAIAAALVDLDRLQRERDELLAVCKVALAAMEKMSEPDCLWCDGGEDSPVDEPLCHDLACPVTIVRAAIAKAEEAK